MPEISNYKCNKCEFSMPQGWGRFSYALNKEGERIVCSHPGETRKAEEITGLSFQN